jgi:hypothetical protein
MLTPSIVRRGVGLLLADRPAASGANLVLGDEWITRTGPVYSVLVEDVAHVRSWLDLSAGGGASSLAAVLAVGNDSGPNSILLAPGQSLDTDAAGQLHLGTGNATSAALGTALGVTSAFQLFINQGGASISSNAGIQFSSTTANRAQLRVNQWGANAGVPGMTAFKSRGLDRKSVV